VAGDDDFADRIARRAERRAKRRRSSNVWFGVSTFGIVGWSVAIPTLVGLAIGIWLDRHVDTERSWTLALLLGGLTLGCINAWYWVSEQARNAEEERQ
jgi:ATP synthase protein I